MDVLRGARAWSADVADCYAALGIVHGLWPYIPGEFDDYIATPKDNNYRSLHTAVIGPGKLPLEVQIRTHEMHDHAELGVAAHWQYKEGRTRRTGFRAEDRLAAAAARARERDDSRARPARRSAGGDLRGPRLCAEPAGRGRRPADAAPRRSTSPTTCTRNLGHRCRGAKVNGRMVPLDHKLANGDTVEIITGKQPNPSRDWLVPQLGYLASSRNRAKVRAWFRKHDEGQNREQGRQMLERELDRLGVRVPCRCPRSSRDLGLPNADALYLGLGERRDLTLAQVAGAIHRRMHEREPPAHAADADDRAGHDGRRRHGRGRRRRPAEHDRALLPAGAARADRGLHHARPRRQHPPRDLREPAAAAR